MRFKEFYRSINSYSSHIITGIGGVLLGLALHSQCSTVSRTEKEEPLFPTTVRVYNIDGYNENKPLAKAMMSDGRTELFSSDDSKGTNYTNLKILEKRDIHQKESEWILKRSELEMRIREAEVGKKEDKKKGK